MGEYGMVLWGSRGTLLQNRCGVTLQSGSGILWRDGRDVSSCCPGVWQSGAKLENIFSQMINVKTHTYKKNAYVIFFLLA